jgi:hypothetical protein
MTRLENRTAYCVTCGGSIFADVSQLFQFHSLLTN